YINPKIFFASSPTGSTGGNTLVRSSAGDGSNGGTFTTFFDSNIDPSGNGDPDEGTAFIPPFLLWEGFDSNNNPTDTSLFMPTFGGVWMTKGALDVSHTPKWYKIIQGGGQVLQASKDGN